MRTLALWRHEARRVGWAAWAASPVALLLPGLAGLQAATRGARPDQVGGLVLSGLEALLPLAVAVTAVTVVSREACRELHLSLPIRHAGTLGRRLALVGAFSAALALIYTGGSCLSGSWTGPTGPAGLLVWVAPTLWLGALAVLLGLVGRSIALATTLVAAVWLIEQLLAHHFAATAWARPFYLFATTRLDLGDDWLPNRLALIASGTVFAATAATLLLRRPHRLLSEEEA